MTADKKQLGLQGPLVPVAINHLGKDHPFVKAEKLAKEGKVQEALKLLRPLASESLTAERAVERLEGLNKVQYSAYALPMLQAYFPVTNPSAGPEIPPVLKRLGTEVQGGKTLREAYEKLSAKDQKEIESTVGGGNLREILFISEATDGNEFWSDVVHFGVKRKMTFNTKDIGVASNVLGLVTQAGESVPPKTLAKAQRELDAIIGKGDAGMHTEFLAGTFVKKATDWKMIAPMVLASPVYHLGKTAALRGLLARTTESVITRGWGARAISTGIGLTGETAFFSLSSRGLTHLFEAPVAWDAKTIGKDLLAAGLTLGLLKSAGFLGRRANMWARNLDEATPQLWTKADHRSMFWTGQVSGYMGLVGAHKLETFTGLRPHVEGSNIWLDALSTHIALGVGSHLGRGLLGSRFAAMEQQLSRDANMLYKASETPRSVRGEASPLEYLNNMVKDLAKQFNGNGFPPGWLPAGAAAMGGSLTFPSTERGLPSHIMAMTSHNEGGGPKLPGGRNGGSVPPGAGSENLDWLRLGAGESRIYLKIPKSSVPLAETLTEEMASQPAENRMEQTGNFLVAVLGAKGKANTSPEVRLDLLENVFLQFQGHHLAENNIHAVTRGSKNQATLLKSYYQAKAELTQAGRLKGEGTHQPAIVKAMDEGKVGMFAQFGGQANAYLGELKTLYETYPEVRPLIEASAEALQKDAKSRPAKKAGWHGEGMDVVAWLKGKAPSDKYLASSAVSQPLILITQLAHYYTNMKAMGLKPGELLSRLKGSTGHSQGVMASVVVASSKTEAEFITNTVKASRYLLWQGIRMAEAAPETSLHPDIVNASVEKGDGVPTPMMGVLKISPAIVEIYVSKANESLPEGRKVEISLVNGPKAVVVSGHPESLYALRELLRKDEATGDQSKTPFSERKLELVTNYFPVSAPFHTKGGMGPVPEALAKDLERLDIRFNPENLSIPVYSTFDGKNLQESKDLAGDLIRMQSVQAVKWELATAKATPKAGVTHVVDFGPGGTAGIGAITARNKEGTGVEVILGGVLGQGRMKDRSYLTDTQASSVSFSQNWGKDFAPGLVRLQDGTLMVDTKFTRTLGKPPVMQAGMTPTSANADFVGAVINAGFHAELAGGGQHNEAFFRTRVSEIMEQVAPGEGITSNLLFLNPYLWGFQAPLVQIMGREGKPMDGVTVAAGVPTVEKATEVIGEFKAAGIEHVAFKPGSVEDIKATVDIAKANPEMTILLQWTGGRGGGHHSYEDAHDPILQTYASIRRLKNIVLVMGSGIGDAKGSFPYINGEWSQKLGYPAMPFDGVLLASRLMVAKEAKTHEDAKKLIVDAPGVEQEGEWEGTYKKDTGGIVTVNSELNAPIHKVATRGVRLWKSFDEKYFSKEAEEMEKAILGDKDRIIKQINADFQKLYFGKKADGSVADLPEMTYSEVIDRMVELMYVAKEGRWMDVTFRDRVFDFMVRTEERLHEKGQDTVALMQRASQLESNPQDLLKTFYERYPQAKGQLIASGDVDYFMALAKRPGKPVNFVPVIDKDLRQWLKKDSLWQSEDLTASPDGDVDRIAILQGPVAVKYSTKVNEPVADILGDVNRGYMDFLKAKYPNEADIPTVEYLGGPEIHVVKPSRDLPTVKFNESDASHKNRKAMTARLPADGDQLPDGQVWTEYLAGSKQSWFRALLTTPRVVRGKDKVANPITQLFRPRAGQRVVTYTNEQGQITEVEVYDPNLMGVLGDKKLSKIPALSAELAGDGTITLTLNHPRPETTVDEARIVSLKLNYRYDPKKGYAPIHEAMPDYETRVKNFYTQLWMGMAGADKAMDLNTTFEDQFTLTRESMIQFRRAVGNKNEAFVENGKDKLQAPMDMAIVAAWQPLVQTLFPKEIGGDIFNLVHRSNSFRLLDTKPLSEGDQIKTQMNITAVTNLENGKLVSVKGKLTRNGGDYAEIESQFFIRGKFNDFENTFSKTAQTRVVDLKKPEDIATLRDKSWAKIDEGIKFSCGEKITFELETISHPKDGETLSKTQSYGVIKRNGKKIGTVEYRGENVKGNIVDAYLGRFGQPTNPAQVFETGGYNLLTTPDVTQSPKENLSYGKASFDLNPIHYNPYIADLAGLPTTITHGMWTSANGRRVLEQHVAKNHPERVVSYHASFEGMVKPGDTLVTQVKHVGMREGRMMVEVETANQNGVTVLKATAEVEQQPTAYIFTGQGSQQPNMGMDLYEASPVAKEIWDTADTFFMNKYGFSILDIVRGDPKKQTELTISFGGPKGAEIRRNYMALQKEVVVDEGDKTTRITAPMFPEITETTTSYTFKGPKGLINATQFTQPALTLVEKAAFADMLSKGVISPKAPFAGHSLGEYAALSAVGNVLPVETMVELVFLRGLTMQDAVPRDAKGRSPYGMAAVNPKALGDDGLQKVVSAISEKTGKLLEVVNLNVDGQQYVVAGDHNNLYILSHVLGPLRSNPAKLGNLDKLIDIAVAKNQREQVKVRQSQGDPGAKVTIRRGALIPLPGIDVPFHSRALRDGVPAFRGILRQGIPEQMVMGRLVGTYIPNLTAKPFSVEKSYVEEVYGLTESPILKGHLDNWATVSKDTQKLGRELLIELLAYQFASPVRWIETQDKLFKAGVERVVELGPGPVLIAMADRTLKTGKYPSQLPRELLSFAGNHDVLYFENPDRGPSAGDHARDVAPGSTPVETAPKAEKAPAKPKKVAPAPVMPPVVLPVASAASGPLADKPVSALETLQVMLAVKLGKPIGEIGEKSIKDLVAGKSAVQNEILGELQKEFGGGPDNANELSLPKLAEEVGASYSTLGKHAQGMVNKLVRDVMPGGFGMSKVKDYLGSERQLGEGRIQGVLLHGLTMAPKGRLGSEAEAKEWLDSVTDSYGAKVGQAIPKGAPAAAGAPVAMAAAAGPAAQPVPDAPVKPLDTLRVMLALKVGKSLGEIAPGTSIKDLVAGKSAVQNEILGELQKEFGGGPENSNELPLSKLAEELGGSYAGLGKHAQGLVNKLVRDVMPSGFAMSKVKDYLATERLLGNGRVEGVLLHGLTMKPEGRLGSEADVKQWLDSVADSYGQAQGITIPKASQSGGGAVAGPAAVGDTKEAKEHRARLDKLIEAQLNTYAEFLGADPKAGVKMAQMEAELRTQAEGELQTWLAEHGEVYANGIKPIFNSAQFREYNSAWNWARQEAIQQFYTKVHTKSESEQADARARLINRASPELLEVLKFYGEMAQTQGNKDQAAYFKGLAEDVKANIGKTGSYSMLGAITQPKVSINAEGKVEYGEGPREGVKTPLDYVEEMMRGGEFPIEKAPDELLRQQYAGMAVAQKAMVEQLKMAKAPMSLIAQAERHLAETQAVLAGNKRVPYLFMKTASPEDPNTMEYNQGMSEKLWTTLGSMAKDGMSLKGKTVLVTGAGPGSIGIETVKANLAAGAKVIVTTSNFSKKRTEFYQKIYQNYGAEGSELIVLPFNQASVQDVKALVDHIYDPAKGLGLDLDYVIPFAGISEQGMDIGNIGSRNELAHRIMLTNTIRLIGEVKNQKEARGILTRPAHVVLPLSPNHGLFGYDGLYAESKLGLEGLKNKWKAEGWNKYMSVAGAVIGWTRGTNLMEGNDNVAPGIESRGARTFSQSEMTFNLMALMHPEMVAEAQKKPLWADFNGGFQMIPDLAKTAGDLRVDIGMKANAKRAAFEDGQLDKEVLGAKESVPKSITPRANMKFAFPILPSAQRLESLSHLRGMVDLEKVVVAVGIGEVGPWGNARTRWEMESKGEFSLEGAVELAWIMGLVQYHDGKLGERKHYNGWIDAKTKEPVPDHQIKERYEETLLKHSGIRLIEPELFEGYDPHNKMFLREVVLEKDMPPRELGGKEDADSYQQMHGDNVHVYEKDGVWYADFKKGATVYLPRAMKFDRFVAGQIPTGWDPARYGVPADIIKQVDPTTLYNLVATVEAFVSAGITDPYELYQYVHVSEAGNTQGGGMGGMRAIRRSFRERMLEKPVQGDILQEQLINVMPAWINMLMLSSSGPIKTLVGACATAAESVEVGVDTIQSGKAKVVLVGGYDDFGEEGSMEFAQMQATSNSKEQVEAGWEPGQHSRPSTSSRAGFMEAQGAGTQVLMSADLAIKMGVPIYGVVALTNTASDKQGSSVPAPGQGILTTAREVKGAHRGNRLLDMNYRKSQLDFEVGKAQEWSETQMAVALRETEKVRAEKGDDAANDYLSKEKDFIRAQANRMEKAALNTWGNEFWKGNPGISPLRGALAVFGLTPDDIEISSFHGTSTAANDRNESEVNHKQMNHLERSPGNPLMTIWQKGLTGHPKGAAAAWMFNGVVQSMLSGVVPGNRNGDNIDPAFRKYSHLLFPNQSLDLGRPLKAGLLKSFGFGQAGAEVLVLNPEFILATLKPQEFQAYTQKRGLREQKSYRHMQGALSGKIPMFRPKTEPPYSEANETQVYFNPLARAKFDPERGSWFFPEEKTPATPKGPAGGNGNNGSSTPPPPSSDPNGRYGNSPKPPAKDRIDAQLRKQAEGLRDETDKGIGVDVAEISTMKESINNGGFIKRNFTEQEIVYCRSSSNPVSSFAGRWAAKEAVVKAMSNAAPDKDLWKGAGAPLKDIEIVGSTSGSPQVVLHGHAKKVAEGLGITKLQVSISHDGEFATASAKAR